MIIARVLNTNTVLTTDATGDEIVLLGAGLGFKRRPGDKVDEKRVEKQFVLKNKANQSSFAKLVERIPHEYIVLAEKLITEARTAYGLELNESIHIALADHIHSAVENFRDGLIIRNPLTLDLRQFYPDEFKLAVHGLELIRAEFGVEFDLDEAGFITMHIVNAETENEGVTAKKLFTLMREIHLIVMDTLHVDPDKTEHTYYRYMTHLKYFAQRVLLDYHFKDEDMGLLYPVASQYRREYACSRKICDYIQEKYGYKSGHDEVLYLTAHLGHLVNMQQKMPNNII